METSDYNQAEYTSIRINAEMLADRGGEIKYFLDFPGTHAKYPVIWAGQDVVIPTIRLRFWCSAR